MKSNYILKIEGYSPHDIHSPGQSSEFG